MTKNINIFEKMTGIPKQVFTNHMVAVTSKAIRRYGLEVNEKGEAVDNEADAFRHTYMQCWLAYRFGDIVAKFLGDDHERGKDPDTDSSTNMDLWNNQIGRELAHEIKEEYGKDLSLFDSQFLENFTMQKVMEKIRKGEVITNPKTDKRKYSNMEKERLRDEDRVFYEDEYWDSMNEDERKRFSTHYVNYKNATQNKFPSKADLDAKVNKGDLIYVNNYTRADGTKVSGYYRRHSR
ncbi:hypothetical protein IJ750_01415 [bacterium]|nr:hypothetical protein [bacterium]